MEKENKNKYIAVMYRLYIDGSEGKPELVEATADGDPFIFVSALGMTLDAFEAQIVPLKVGDRFDFTLAPNDAYGEYDEAGKHALPRNVFEINGKLDSRYIYEVKETREATNDEVRDALNQITGCGGGCGGCGGGSCDGCGGCK